MADRTSQAVAPSSLILALDQGTTSCRAILFGRDGEICGLAQKEFRQIYPQSGWVEQDPEEIWAAQIQVAHEAMAKAGAKAGNIAALGITNQRETTLLWDRRSGQPIHNAIVWQDRRTASFCDGLKRGEPGEVIARKSGLVPDAYFSGSKLRWLLDNIPTARKRAEHGELAFGTIDTWLLWKLTGGALHATDPSNASRTMLFNLETGAWDDELLALMSVPREVLPTVRASSELYAETAQGVFDGPIQVGGVAGDQQAALFGQNCFRRGLAKNTYGTGCFMLMNIGGTAARSASQLLTTVAWQIGKTTDYALEGSVFIGGAVVQWLRDGLGLIRSSGEVESLAGSVADAGGVYFVPAFVGLGTPHWDPHARGTITGLTRGTSAAHLARAALEGIAFQVADVLDVMKADSGITLNEMRVDGGAAMNNLLLQFQADILRVPVVRPKMVESTAWGAATLAGLAAGFWKDRAEVETLWKADRVFEPALSADEAAHRRLGWTRALGRAKHWETG